MAGGAAIPAELEVTDLEVTLPDEAGCAHVSFYGRAPGYGAPLLDSSTGVPLIAISAPRLRCDAPDDDADQSDDAFLHSLWAELMEHEHPGGGQLARFELHTDPARDRWSAPACFAPAQLERLGRFVRSRLFAVWRQICPALETLRGSFELFNPAHGANMGWHQDGHVAGEFIAHYYLRAWNAGGETAKPDAEREAAGSEAMNWLELALPRLAETDDSIDTADDGDGDGFAAALLDFGSDDAARRRRVRAPNFLALPVGGPEQRLLVFEDARVYHRTPLTAHAFRALQPSQLRPIARLVCSGSSADGSELSFAIRADAAEAAGGAVRVTSRAAPVCRQLPAGLRRALGAFEDVAAARRGASVEAIPLPAGELPPASASVLDLYVAADAEMVGFLREQGMSK
jgi:hypothetical protein